MNSLEDNDYVGSDTSVPSSSTIPLADPPAVVVIEATGLQRIYNVIVFAVATLHVVVIFCFLLLLHLLAKSSAPAARADLAIAFETPPIPPFVHLDQIDIFFASSWSDRYYYLFCMKQSTETSGYPQAPRIPSSSPITWWSRTYLHKLSAFS